MNIKLITKTLTTGALAALLGFAGIAAAQTIGGLTVGVTGPATVAASTSQTLAIVSLTANNASGATLAALPLSVGYSSSVAGSGPAAPLSNCALNNGSNTGASLNSGHPLGSLGSGQTSVTFDSPLSVPANGSVVLYLVCDISPSVPNGSAVAIMVPAQNISATSTTGTVSATNSTPGGVTAATITSATPGGASTATVGSTTPGTPNTGAGGSAPINFAILTLSGLVAVGAAVYLARLLKRHT